jgi:hypothetical protein
VTPTAIASNSATMTRTTRPSIAVGSLSRAIATRRMRRGLGRHLEDGGACPLGSVRGLSCQAGVEAFGAGSSELSHPRPRPSTLAVGPGLR